MSSKIDIAVELLRSGDLIAFPTETVYGLGADATNPMAVRRIFALKGRPVDHPLIVHVENRLKAERWGVFNETARRIADRYWPGPLTLVVPKREGVLDEVTGGLNTIGLRCPDHPIARSLLKTFGSGIAAPSANRFGKVSPTQAIHVRAEFGNQLHIIDGGNAQIGIESTILDLCGTQPAILRPGFITNEEIEQTWGPLGVSARKAPGVLNAHYAPKTSLLLSQNPSADAQRLRASGLNVATLSAQPSSDYARILYAELRRLDQLNVDVLVVEMAEEGGIGRAVNDRLKKAANGSPVTKAFIDELSMKP